MSAALRDFDTALDRAGVTRLRVGGTTTAPVVSQTVTVTLARSAPVDRAAHLGKPDAAWTWEDLRDYVVAAIEHRHGPFPRQFLKESGIFKGFLNRWGERAAAIARYAFEQCDGMWMSAPIGVARFTAGNDPYFASAIAERL